MLKVVWQKNAQNNEWFDLLRLDLSSAYFTAGKKGVFVIWYVGAPSNRVLKVGSGIILEQLKNLKSNPTILDYSKNGSLKVSWVAVNEALKESDMLGVEAFLYDSYKPVLGERTSTGTSIPINLIGEN